MREPSLITPRFSGDPMSLNVMARKFELKLALAADKPSIDYEAFKNKAAEELRKNFLKMAVTINESVELRAATFTMPEDPLATFGEKAQQGIADCKDLVGEIFKISNKRESLPLEGMVASTVKIAAALARLAKSSGSDKWGKPRSKYLNALEILGDYFTTQGAYGNGKALNAMAKKDLEGKFGRLTKTLDSIANTTKKSIDLLKKMSEHGLIDKTSLDNLVNNVESMGDTTREVGSLHDHERETILRLFNEFLGLDKLNLMPVIETWHKYIGTSPEVEKNLSDVFRAYMRADTVADRKSKGKTIGEDEVIFGPDQKVLSATTVRKLGIAARYIALNKANQDSNEKLRSEQLHGSPDPKSRIAPLKGIREIIDGLSSTERALWHMLPPKVQVKVFNNQADLQTVLEIAQAHPEQMVGNKLDPALFESLGI